VHEAVCARASVAWHDSKVEPTGNWEWDFGVQLVLTGAVPPLKTGSSYFTTAFPLFPLMMTAGMCGH